MKGQPSSYRRVAGVTGRGVCWHSAEVAFLQGKQGGTAEISVLVPVREQGRFFISPRLPSAEKPERKKK